MPVYFRTFLPSIQGTEAWRNRQSSNHQEAGREAFLLHLHYSWWYLPPDAGQDIQEELYRGKKRTEIHKMPARRQERQKHCRRDGGEQGDSHWCARHSEKAIRGEISDRADEAHRLLGCQWRKGDESQQLIQLQLPLHLAYPYRFEARQGTCHRYQHAL